MRLALVFLLAFAACGPKEPLVHPDAGNYKDEPIPDDDQTITDPYGGTTPHYGTTEQEKAEREFQRKQAALVDAHLRGDRRKLWDNEGKPWMSSNGKLDPVSLSRATYWVYGRKRINNPNGTIDYHCKDYFYFTGDKISGRKKLGNCS